MLEPASPQPLLLSQTGAYTTGSIPMLEAAMFAVIIALTDVRPRCPVHTDA